MERLPHREDSEEGRGQAASWRRVLAVVEVLALVCGVFLLWWLISRHTPGKRWEWRWFGGWFVVKLLLLTVLPIALLVVTRRSLGDHAISFHAFGYQVKAGLLSLAGVMPASLAFAVLLWLHIGFAEWRGALVLLPVQLASLAAVALLLRRQPTRPEPPRSWGIGIYLAIFVGVAVLSAVTRGFAPQVSLFAGALFATGFGEEILFRGYVQSRLNRAFGRPWRLFGVPVGWGWLIASAVFGLAHWLPNTGGTAWWALWTMASGLLFGWLREKTGGIVASGIAHGLPLAIGTLLMASGT